jgi:hypothetical protein
MSEWIELNLPYSVSGYFDGTNIKAPELEDRALAELGFNKSSLLLLRNKMPDVMAHNTEYDDAMDKINAALREDHEYGSVGWQVNKVKLCFHSENQDIKNTGLYLEKLYEYEDWEASQPDVISYEKELEEARLAFDLELNKRSFVGMKLNVPGTLIEVKSGDDINQYLIGHINDLAGVCDDCRMFPADAIVLRYKNVWNEV